LNLPEDSNWPSALFIAADGSQAVLFIFQLAPRVNCMMPRVKLQGLDPQAEYFVDERGPFSGSVLMGVGLLYSFQAEYASKVVFLEKKMP
jgi:alpha-galactosidase